MHLRLILAAVALLLGLAPARLAASPLPDSACAGQTGVNPGGSTAITFSCSETQVLASTFATNNISSYATAIMAEIGNGAYLFDQTFDAPYSSSTVQSAISQAEADLLSGGATSYTGPTLTATMDSTSSSSATTTTSVLDPSLTSDYGVGTSVGTTPTSGPTTILVGDLGLCQGIAPAGTVDGGILPYGCPGGLAFPIFQGQTVYDVNVNYQYDVTELTTTTVNTLTSQTYNLDGSMAATSVTPEPSSLILLGTGVLGMAGVLRKRFASA